MMIKKKSEIIYAKILNPELYPNPSYIFDEKQFKGLSRSRILNKIFTVMDDPVEFDRLLMQMDSRSVYRYKL